MRSLVPISKLLLPHKENIGAFAGIVTIFQFLSGSLLCNDIRKRGSSTGFPLVPLLGGVVLCAISIQFGYFIRDVGMIKVNFIGFALSVIYCLIYYWYTPNAQKTQVWGKFGIGGALVAAIIAYAQYEDPELVEFRFGVILTILLLGLIGSPLADLPEIIKKKSTEGLPFPIILSGTIVSFAWLTYAITINNDFMIFQNVAAVAISVVQLALFAIYPNKATPSAIKKKSKKAE